jgi:signal transduction histidine kinase
MIDLFQTFFNTNYIPHGHCYLWQPRLVWLHATSDALTALAYYSIPVLLLFFIQKRKDFPFKTIFILFGAFIVSCGTTHILDVWTLWQPIYWVSGFTKAFTASISLFTALAMVPLLPKALSLPSPAELETANRKLEQQIIERQQANRELRESQARLQLALDFEALLKRITDKVRDSLDENYILQTVVLELGTGLGVSCCNAALYDLKSGVSTIQYEYTNYLVSTQGQAVRLADNPEIYSQLLRGDIFQLCFTDFDPIRGRVALLACPIMDDQRVLGDLWLINDRDYVFRDLELRVVQQIANQCAIALRQARLYQTAQAQVQELESLNRLKDDFLSTVSHELRTPISNIRIAAHMLEVVWREEQKQIAAEGRASLNAHALSQRTDRYFQILRTECQREAQLINDLLDLSRLDAKADPLEITSLKLSTWLPEIVESFVDRIQSHDQHLKLDLPPNLPIVATDASDLARILTELLNNACKYTPAGETIAVAAQLKEPVGIQPHQNTVGREDLHSTLLSPPTSSISICISNSGVEIPVSEQGQIFDKFYRIPNNPWKYGGTGLGLALVKKLVERLGAKLHLESFDNQVTFVLELAVPSATMNEE